MPMTFAERADALASHPDTVTINLAGKPRKWFLGKVSFDLARAAGLDLGEVLGAFDGVDAETGAAALSPMMDAFGRLLYFGMLPFDEGLAEADVTGLLSVGDMTRLLPAIMGALSAEAAEAQGKAEAAAQGARDRRKRPA